MKRLVLGGACQGKLEYACRTWKLSQDQIGCCGELPPEKSLQAPLICHLHLAVAALLDRGDDPSAFVLSRLEARENWIVLCDEVGCGVIPVEARDRRFREAVGELCCALAELADTVDRVACGLPLRLKGRQD